MIHSTLAGDGTEQTRGFYSYYLTTNTAQPHKQYSDLNPLQAESKKIKLDLSRLETKEVNKKRMIEHIQPRKYFEKKSKIHKDVVLNDTYNVMYFTLSNNYTLRKKRVKRNARTLVAGSNEASKKGAHLHIHTVASSGTDTKEQRTYVNVNNNGTTTNITDDETHRRHLISNEKYLKDDVLKIKPPNTWLQINNRNTKHNHGKKTAASDTHRHTDGHTKKRQKRFLQLFSRSENDDNFIFRALNFLVKNRKSIVPVISVVRDINTLVKSGNGELNHVTREKNNYVGIEPPPLAPVTYSLELGNESKLMAFVKRLFGLTPKGDRLTIGSG